MRREVARSILTAIPISMLMVGVAFTLSTYFNYIKLKTKDPLEVQLTTTLKALQENSRHAIELSTHLQTEVANRTKALQEMETAVEELRHRRTLLDLTPEQEKALQALTHRSPTAGEIFTSLDFWLGKFLPGIFFFMLGILYQRLRARRVLATPLEDQQKPHDQSPPQIPDPR